MKVFIPENLDFPRVLRNVPPAFKYHIDDFYYILGLITNIPANNKDLLEKYNGYVPINAATVQRKIRNYNKYLQYLLTNKIFMTDGFYLNGRKSKGYKFCPWYNTPVVQIEISKREFDKAKLAKSKIYKANRKKMNWLGKWFSEDMEIDFKEASNYTYSLLETNTDANVKNALLKFNCAYLCINRIAEGDFYFNKDETVGRLHTNLTTMHKELRNFITFKGQKLVAVDISNSQPYLSTLLFNTEVYNSNNEISSIISKYLSYNIGESIVSYIMLVKSNVSQAGRGFQYFVDLVVNGKLYDVIAQQYTKETGVIIPDRREIKRMMFIVLFTDNRYYGHKDALAKRIFSKLFPDVYEVFKKVKQKQKSALPCILQAIEAHIMLNIVARRISKERPDMPIFTIHDSIACPVGCEEYVAAIMREELEKLVGYPPTLKYEYWTPEEAWKSLEQKKAATRVTKAA